MKFHVLGERPKMTPNGIAIPAEWTIFNAPRPLYAGSVTIQNEAGEIPARHFLCSRGTQ